MPARLRPIADMRFPPDSRLLDRVRLLLKMALNGGFEG